MDGQASISPRRTQTVNSSPVYAKRILISHAQIYVALPLQLNINADNPISHEFFRLAAGKSSSALLD